MDLHIECNIHQIVFRDKNVEKKEKRRVLADFYKKMFTKSWMQRVRTNIDWHQPSSQDDSVVASAGSITSQGNLGPGGPA